MKKPTVLVFATGEETAEKGGGSGVRKLVEMTRDKLAAMFDIPTVASSYADGGVNDKIGKLNEGDYEDIEFIHVPKPPGPPAGKEFGGPEHLELVARHYDEVLEKYRDTVTLIALSGHMHLFKSEIFGPQHVINIHPGPTQDGFGGKGMHGDHVHEEVWRRWNLEDGNPDKIRRTAVTMHFVTDEFDIGPVIGQFPVSLEGCTSAEDVQQRVNKLEHIVQWQVTEAVANGWISWSGDENETPHMPFDRRYYFGKKFSLTDERLPAGFVDFNGENTAQFERLFNRGSVS